MTLPDRSSLTPEELRVLEATLEVSAAWEDKPKSHQRAGALTAIGAIWTKLGWLGMAAREADNRALGRKRSSRWEK